VAVSWRRAPRRFLPRPSGSPCHGALAGARLRTGSRSARAAVASPPAITARFEQVCNDAIDAPRSRICHGTRISSRPGAALLRADLETVSVPCRPGGGERRQRRPSRAERGRGSGRRDACGGAKAGAGSMIQSVPPACDPPSGSEGTHRTLLGGRRGQRFTSCPPGRPVPVAVISARARCGCRGRIGL
jgi:hypothetical protein